MLLVILAGGASRADAQSQLIVRMAAIVCACLALLGGGARPLAYRSVLLFLAAYGLLAVVQLIPLPPEMWTKLPGRELLAQAGPLAGMEQPWRPISVTPDLTINSLMSLLPALAAVAVFALLDRQHWHWVLAILGLLILFSGVMGLVQVSGKVDMLYLYRITNYDTAVGVFANRNHQALLLPMAFPLIAAIAVFPNSPISDNSTARAALVGASLFFLPLILVTGSRAGLVLTLIGAGSALLLYLSSGQHVKDFRRSRAGAARAKWLWIAAVVAALILVWLTVSLSKAEAVQRLFSQDVEQEKRYLLFWPMVQMAETYFPAGAGLGSFPDIFRIHEPFENLSLTYMNHAHNDLVELAIEGGAAGILLLVLFLLWLILRSYRVWSAPAAKRYVIMGRLGSINILMILLASLADYPIRTPIISVLLVLSCCWLCLGEDRQQSAPRVRDPAPA
jgi:O-antigen ligase